MKTSKFLKCGEIYCRDELRRAFGIQDATLNNGIFKPHGHDSVWLFVTENKTPHRKPYTAPLSQKDMYMEGQTRGRTDSLITEHRSRGLELLLFYREDKSQYEHASFRFEGIFRYISHQGSRPIEFHLARS